MKRLLRLWPSPAMVVACIALGIALAGTSVAAIQGQPKNSVGTKQLKRNATSATDTANAANAMNATNATNSSPATSVANLAGARANAPTKAADFAYGEIDVAGIVKANRGRSSRPIRVP